MYKKLIFILVLICTATNAQQINNNFFIQNKGQWNPEVKYLARIRGMNAWITNSGVVYDYYQIKKNFDESKTNKRNQIQKRDYENKNTTIKGHVVKMQLVNSEKEVSQIGNNQKEGYYNYFIGNVESKWASNVPLYDNVELQGVYKNIDVKYYYNNGMLRYDYKAKPGADLSQIKFKFNGQDGISINSQGELVLKTSIGEVTNGKIYAYQIEGGIQKEVSCQFEQKVDGSIGLKAATYNEKKELIVDPLVYSTFIGGSGYDYGYSIAIDASRNAYITGDTESSDYPTTSGAYQTTFKANNKNYNAFVTKLNPTGTGLVYSTFIGGSGYDYGESIAIDASGNAYIAGQTESSNYPTTNGAYQSNLKSTNSVFVTKLNPTGAGLVYSTFIGGSYYDIVSIAIDASGNAYITGGTESSDYPTTSGAYQTTLKGINAFVTKLNPTGTRLIYSTFIGGSVYDNGNSIAIDASGSAYITGKTESSDYPTTNGAYQSNLKSSESAFVTKLNPTGTGLVYSTFIGGSGADRGRSIAIDASRNAYITGLASSQDYPTTSGAYQAYLNGFNIFVTKLNPTGTGLVYSTFIGGSDVDYAYSIAIDASGNAFITGATYSTDYPTTSGAFQTTLKNYPNAVVPNPNGFVTKLNPTGTGLVYSTFIGGSGYWGDSGESIAIDANGNAYITGGTSSTDYPTTSGAYQTTLKSEYGNAFVTKLNLSPQNSTSILINNSSLPNIFGLKQNYPNPFNPITTINYSIPKSSYVTIKVYDILGREVTTLVNENKPAGNYSIQFNASKLTSGIYFYRMQAGDFVKSKKLVLLK